MEALVTFTRKIAIFLAIMISPITTVSVMIFMFAFIGAASGIFLIPVAAWIGGELPTYAFLTMIAIVLVSCGLLWVLGRYDLGDISINAGFVFWFVVFPLGMGAYHLFAGSAPS